MGCACLRVSRKLSIVTVKAGKNNKGDLMQSNLIYIEKSASKKLKYLDKISKNTWMKIIDFLSFKDLKEVGKTNRLFNKFSKSFQILTKFFKNKAIKIKGVYAKNNNLTTNISNNIILINHQIPNTPNYKSSSNKNLNYTNTVNINSNPIKIGSESSVSSVPSFQKSSLMHSSQLYFSSNNNSSSNGTLSSLQKTLNNLKYLKDKTNTYGNNSTDNFSEINLNKLNKLFDSNKGWYRDIFNKSELDFTKIKSELSRNSSINKTPTFSSAAFSDNEKLLNSILENNNSHILKAIATNNNISRFLNTNLELNTIYEENKNENNEKDEKDINDVIKDHEES